MKKMTIDEIFDNQWEYYVVGRYNSAIVVSVARPNVPSHELPNVMLIDYSMYNLEIAKKLVTEHNAFLKTIRIESLPET